MRPLIIISALLLLAGCGPTRLALSPAQCTAPTAQEAALTKTVWQTKVKKVR